jgi:hypothetical protein
MLVDRRLPSVVDLIEMQKESSGDTFCFFVSVQQTQDQISLVHHHNSFL